MGIVRQDMRSTGTRTISEQLADYVVDLRFEAVPASVVEKAKDHLVYHLGLALRGQDTEIGRQAVGLALELSGGGGVCSIVGDRRRATPLDAVFANSFLMGHDRLDDVQMPPAVHPGIITQPIAWTIGETTGASGRELLTAVILGYDVMTRLCKPVWTWGLPVPRRGTGVVGPLGGAATAARLLHLSREQTVHALGHAGQAAMGIAEGTENIRAMKPLLARNGLMAALLAKAGMAASPTIIEGRHGVYRSFFFQDVPESLQASLATLGRDFDISKAQTQRLGGVSALTQRLVKDSTLTPGQVVSVEVVLPEELAQREAVWEEAALSPRIGPTRTGANRLRVACVIADGWVDPARMQRPPDPDLLAVLEKVRLRFEDGHAIRYARVEVTTTDGQRLTAESDTYVVPPLNWEEWIAEGGRAILSDEQVARLVQLIRHLEDVTDVAEVMACVVPAVHGD